MKTSAKVYFISFVLIAAPLMISYGNLISKEAKIESLSWLSGWSYRKAHNVTGSSAGSQINYPVLFSIRYDNGADNGGEVYLNGKCRSDFGDIRFTDSTGIGSLNYWIQQKTDGVQAIIWVKINSIPKAPDCATVYVYYGNSSASTTSNKDWAMDLATDFEDGTTQGWTISWTTWVDGDGVTGSAFEGSYCRYAGRAHGSGSSGNGDFYERFRQQKYLSEGSYIMEGAGRFSLQDSYQMPQWIRLMVGEATVDEVASPGISWQWLSNNFTISVGIYVQVSMEFHLYSSSLLMGGTQTYYMDYFFIRKWCDPEPSHGTWSAEQTSSDNTPPEIFLVAWIPTAPYPYVKNYSLPRQWEPIDVMANVSDEAGGSGLAFVGLCYRVNSSEWWNVTMTFNETSGFWTTTIPGQLGGSHVEFYVVTLDKAGNANTGGVDSYYARTLPIGDINGDGKVGPADFAQLSAHYGQQYP